ncbi:MAG: GNAT family N-acetyltransferase [Paeniglutamicibacter sp.]
MIHTVHRQVTLAMFNIREYQPADERGWLECRLLSFLDSNYYDDVRTDRSDIEAPNLSLVAEDNGTIVGLIDIELDGDAATIDSIAVHPGARQQGMASALLDEALARLPSGTRTLDAWTREDAAANGWYQRNGFEEAYRYLHVYKGYSEPNDGFQCPEGLSRPVLAFMHADIKDEESMRRAFKRVYVCRQVRRLGPA